MNTEIPLELLSARENLEDTSFSFAPTSFDDYIGQSHVKEKLKMYTQACKMRSEHLDHLLLFGPPGLGKTTLAHIMGKELGVNVRITSGPVLERSGDLIAILSNIAEKEILFIDEIHRMPTVVEESLYSAMENFCVDMIIGQGAGAKSVRLPLNPFTIIGATTKASLLSAPLQTRFGIIERLDFYEPSDLGEIVMQNARFFGIDITKEAAFKIGKASRGTPRIVKRILRRVRDFAQVNNHSRIDEGIVREALAFFGIDDDGLNKLDRDILTTMLKDFDGGPVGLDTLAAMTGEDSDTLENVCEPFLMRQGLLQKTARGRQIPANKVLSLRKRLLGEIFDEQKVIF